MSVGPMGGILGSAAGAPLVMEARGSFGELGYYPWLECLENHWLLASVPTWMP